MFSERDYRECQRLLNKYYETYRWHDELYREAIGRHVKTGDRVLDAGCGRYLNFCREFSNVAEMVGIDLERELETRNQRSPFGLRGDVGFLPFASESFDMVISRSVVEHLSDPPQVFREFARVLRPRGRIVMITPNRWDYVSIAAALTPYSLHRAFVSRVCQVAEDDVFPTRYRANTRRALRKALTAAGFAQCEMEMLPHYPAYLMFSPVLFRIGVGYERLTSFKPLHGLRSVILCVFQKREESRAAAPNSTTTRESAPQRASAGVA